MGLQLRVIKHDKAKDFHVTKTLQNQHRSVFCLGDLCIWPLRQVREPLEKNLPAETHQQPNEGTADANEVASCERMGEEYVGKTGVVRTNQENLSDLGILL